MILTWPDLPCPDLTWLAWPDPQPDLNDLPWPHLIWPDPNLTWLTQPDLTWPQGFFGWILIQWFICCWSFIWWLCADVRCLGTVEKDILYIETSWVRTLITVPWWNTLMSSVMNEWVNKPQNPSLPITMSNVSMSSMPGSSCSADRGVLWRLAQTADRPAGAQHQRLLCDHAARQEMALEGEDCRTALQPDHPHLSILQVGLTHAGWPDETRPSDLGVL